ncbi:MAG: DUF2313 domain-containing protein, partial [Oscillibacter sp.]|nr:DUF2313 domain-containing protein [Oscillibacter sp.]
MDLEHFPTSPAAKRMLASVSEEFYAKAYVAKWLYQVMGLEWDTVREIIDALPEQSFVETATWGLMYHEIKWGLPVRENLDYATRRRLIYEKRDVRKPMNPWAMEQIIYDLTGRLSRVMDSHDDPSIPANTFIVEIESAETDLDICAILQKIRTLKQSHVAFTFLICAKANVRISTPAHPHRFPYRMTGEHPDINVWGGMERGRFLAETDAKGHAFPYPVTGPHLAGTAPDTNTPGFQRGTGVTAAAHGAGTIFPYAPAGVGVAGTLPDTNTSAYIRDAGVQAEASGEATAFPYVQTGVRPDINTAGYVRRSAVLNEAEGEG